MTWPLAELERLVAQMIRVGTIKSVDLSDASAPTCVVTNGGLDTDSLPWVSLRAGADSEFWCPDIGEQALVLSPFGDMAQGFVIVGIFQGAMPSPGLNPDVRVTRYKDGAIESYDRANSKYLLQVPVGGSITLQVGSTSLAMVDGKATLTAQQFEHVGNQATFDGQVTVNKLLSWLSGVAGAAGSSGGANAIDGGVNVINGDVTVDGIGVKKHHHIEHDGPGTSPSVA
jgi:phage baseplate assembly protein V